jgi:hypothetical protein
MFAETASPAKQRSELRETDQGSSAQFGRVVYLRKLYFLLFLQLLLATIVVGLSFSNAAFNAWITTYTGVSFWTAFILFVIIQFGM